MALPAPRPYLIFSGKNEISQSSISNRLRVVPDCGVRYRKIPSRVVGPRWVIASLLPDTTLPPCRRFGAVLGARLVEYFLMNPFDYFARVKWGSITCVDL